MLEVKNSPGKGRGVFATLPIEEGVCFESSPVLEIPQDQKRLVKKSVIAEYYFIWGPNGKDRALALGFGSLFNHSYQPNAFFELNHESNTIDFYALRPISIGEEITINYNGVPDSTAPVWFTIVD
ncbi:MULTISPECIES: SET domain-containing protein [Bacillus]|uniref:SET domain-containing protein n=1 Tax=Bacillus TaxID=1386 RepID=UPI000BB816A6|nr:MULTISPECIES: SET domain-containing protein [Bacillus]